MFKKVTLKVIIGKERIVREYKTPNGKQWTSDGENNLLKSQTDLLEQRFPDHDFRMIEIGPHQFNFIGEKKVPDDGNRCASVRPLGPVHFRVG